MSMNLSRKIFLIFYFLIAGIIFTREVRAEAFSINDPTLYKQLRGGVIVRSEQNSMYYIHPKKRMAFSLATAQDISDVLHTGFSVRKENLERVPLGILPVKQAKSSPPRSIVGFIAKHLGEILFPHFAPEDVWYLSPIDRRRYSIKNLDDAVVTLRALAIPISENDFSNLIGIVPEATIVHRTMNRLREPRLFNKTLIWLETTSPWPNEDFQLFLKDFEKNDVTLIRKTDNVIRHHHLSDRYVVWEEYKPKEGQGTPLSHFSNVGIFFYDRLTKTINDIQSTSLNVITEPHLDGHRVVYWNKVRWWKRGDEKGYDRHVGNVYVYDLETKKEMQITSDGWNYEPVISGNSIAWFNDEDVFYKDLESSKVERLTNDSNFRGELSASPSTIVWNNYKKNSQKVYSYGTMQGGEYYDLTTKKKGKFPILKTKNNIIHRAPILDRRLIVYEGSTNEIPFAAYLFDIDRNETLRVNRETYQTFAQGGRVIWTTPYADYDRPNEEQAVFFYEYVPTSK